MPVFLIQFFKAGDIHVIVLWSWKVDLLTSRVTLGNFRSVEEIYDSVNYNRNSEFYIRKENIWRLRQRGLLRPLRFFLLFLLLLLLAPQGSGMFVLNQLSLFELSYLPF
jgi:hypothetical protein